MYDNVKKVHLKANFYILLTWIITKLAVKDYFTVFQKCILLCSDIHLLFQFNFYIALLSIVDRLHEF